MNVELAAANAVGFVIAHLTPLALSDKHIGARKWVTGNEMPYRWVTRVAGPEDDWADFPVIRTHTLARSYDEAAREADETHRRMRLLVENPQDVDMVIEGRAVDLEDCETLMAPRPEPYTAESVATRFVSEYRLVISFVAV